jgi:hypothetical protein
VRCERFAKCVYPQTNEEAETKKKVPCKERECRCVAMLDYIWTGLWTVEIGFFSACISTFGWGLCDAIDQSVGWYMDQSARGRRTQGLLGGGHTRAL